MLLATTLGSLSTAFATAFTDFAGLQGLAVTETTTPCGLRFYQRHCAMAEIDVGSVESPK